MITLALYQAPVYLAGMKRALPILLLVGHSAWAQSIPAWKSLLAETAKPAQVSLTQDGAWLPTPTKAGTSLEIHDNQGVRPQFLDHFDGVALLFYVDRDALTAVSLGRAVLRPTESTPTKVDAKTIAMPLHAGTTIDEMSPAKTGVVKVKLGWKWGEGNSLEARGYLEDASIGTVYKVEYPPQAPFEPDVTLPGDFKLLDAPTGTAWVFSKNRERVEAMVLERKGRSVLVRIAQRAVGWIAAAQVKPIPKADENGEEGGEVGGVMGGVLGEGRAKQTLALDTPLFDRIDGVFIGQVTEGFAYAPAEQKDGWKRYDVKTSFGMVGVWSRPKAESGLRRARPPVDK